MVVYAKGRKIEKIRIYDKIYSTSEWLLMYEYNKLKDQEYESEDKVLEKAVREHAKSHDMAQFLGYGFDIPPHIQNEKEKQDFRNLVIDEFSKYNKAISDQSWETVMSHNQSPVFCIENEEFREKFDYVFSYIGENLSFFSDTIRKRLHEAQNTTADRVRHQYISLQTLNTSSCQPFEEETVDDPYVSVLKSIRYEYRGLTRTYKEKWDEIKWAIYSKWYKLKNITKPPI
jgi:hypothetical protein